jgi:hypothetical protein
LQDRPFRQALTAEQAGSFLKMLAGKGELDAEIVATVIQDMDVAMLAADPMSAA